VASAAVRIPSLKTAGTEEREKGIPVISRRKFRAGLISESDPKPRPSMKKNSSFFKIPGPPERTQG
jgi:hypothetical protein